MSYTEEISCANIAQFANRAFAALARPISARLGGVVSAGLDALSVNDA